MHYINKSERDVHSLDIKKQKKIEGEKHFQIKSKSGNVSNNANYQHMQTASR